MDKRIKFIVNASKSGGIFSETTLLSLRIRSYVTNIETGLGWRFTEKKSKEE